MIRRNELMFIPDSREAFDVPEQVRESFGLGGTLTRVRACDALQRAEDTEPMTGLLTRRAFSSRLKRRPVRTTVLALEARPAGGDRLRVDDQDLVLFAAALHAVARPGELAARWNPTRFAVAISGADPSGVDYLDRLREVLAGSGIRIASGGLVVGVDAEPISAIDAVATSLDRTRSRVRTRAS